MPDHHRTTNPPVELARYRISDGERVVRGQRVLGIVRVTDVPASGSGRAVLVERGLTSKAELDALVADYVAQAAIRDAVPALTWLGTC
jgi:DNA polymerase elongation subunit (family B)